MSHNPPHHDHQEGGAHHVDHQHLTHPPPLPHQILAHYENGHHGQLHHAEPPNDSHDSHDPPHATLLPPPEHSILHHGSAPKVAKKGVEFDPSLRLHELENSAKKGHSKQQEVNKDALIDLSGAHGKRIFCRNLHSSLLPLSILLRIFGRFPLSSSQNPDNFTFEYTSNCSSWGLFYFNTITFLLFYALLAGLYNVTYVLLDVPILRKSFGNDVKAETIYKTQLAYDKVLIQRNAIPVIIVFTALLQACTSSVLLTKKHDYLAHIFSFLNKAAYTLHMDLAEKAKNFSVQSTVMFTTVMSIFIILSCLKFGTSSIGTPTVFGSLMVRLLLGIGSKRVWLDLERRRGVSSVQIIGGVFLVIIFTCSVAPILLFIYKCKIVRNAFAFWNGRAYCALLRGREHAQTEEARTTYNLLFKDHCILLDLLDSVDQMYSFTLESFFGLQVVSLFFQMYLLYRNGTQSKYSSITQPLKGQSLTYLRPYDWVPTLLIIFATSVTLLVAGRAAADVAEEAEAGVEVIRRKGVIGRRTDQELEFLHSMTFSFQAYKQMHISGAGYLYYNKGFLIQLAAVCLFCFFLLCQFRPLLDYQPSVVNESMGIFLRRIEGNSDHNNSWTNEMDDREWALGF